MRLFFAPSNGSIHIRPGPSTLTRSPGTHIALLLLANLSVFSWFRPDLLPYNGDVVIPLSPIENLVNLYTWIPNQLGMESYGAAAATLFLFFAGAKLVGLNLVQTTATYYYCVYAIASVSMYYLAWLCLSNMRYRGLAAVTAGLFYVVNPYVMIVIPAYLPYAFMPLILALYVRLVNGARMLPGSTMIAGAITIGVMPDMPQYKMLLVAFTLMLMYSLWCIVIERMPWLRVAKAYMLTGLLAFVLNAWFYLPFLHNLLGYQRLATLSAGVSIDSYGDKGWATVRELLRLLGGAGFYAAAPYGQDYLSRWWIPLTNFAIVSLAVLPVVVKRPEKMALLFLGIGLASIFFAKGSNPPFAQPYEWLVNSIVFFRVMRTTASLNLGTCLSLAMLVGCATSLVYGRFRRHRAGPFAIMAVCALIIVNAYPVLLGGKTRNEAGDRAQHGLHLPTKYFEAAEFLKGDSSDYGVLVLPPRGGYELTTWGHVGANSLPFIFGKATIVGPDVGYGYMNEQRAFLSVTYDQLDAADDVPNFAEIVGGAGIKYVAFQKDFLFAAESQRGLEWYSSRLQQAAGLSPAFESDAVDVYQVDDRYVHPRVYSASVSGMGGGDTEGGGEGSTLPHLTFKRVNPTQYSVLVEQAEVPYVLIFLQSFHPGWRLFLASERDALPKQLGSSQAYFGGQVQEEKRSVSPVSAALTSLRTFASGSFPAQHVIVNGFANGWLIEKTGSYELMILYEPQRLFDAGILASTVVCGAALAAGLWPSNRRRWVKSAYTSRPVATKRIS